MTSEPEAASHLHAYEEAASRLRILRGAPSASAPEPGKRTALDLFRAAPPEAPSDDGGPEADSPGADPSESPNPDATAASEADATAKPGGEVRVGRGLFHSQLFRSE